MRLKRSEAEGRRAGAREAKARAKDGRKKSDAFFFLGETLLRATADEKGAESGRSRRSESTGTTAEELWERT